MNDDEPIDTTACASCGTHIPDCYEMRRCGICEERCCDECLRTNEARERLECAACREGEALYKDTVGAIDYSRRGNL